MTAGRQVTFLAVTFLAEVLGEQLTDRDLAELEASCITLDLPELAYIQGATARPWTRRW